VDSPCRGVEDSFNTERAFRAQKLLARLVSLETPGREFRRILGLDVAYHRLEGLEVGVGVGVIIDAGSLRPLECLASYRLICVPYIPGLLAFREMAVLAPLASRLAPRADVMLVDGHGIAHPRRLGIASHLGLAVGMPSIGVAKRKLVGEVRGDEGVEYIIHEGVRVGVVLRTPSGSRLYVSPGHMISLEDAARVVASTIKTGAPEPLRLADAISKRLKRSAAVRRVRESLANKPLLADCGILVI